MAAGYRFANLDLNKTQISWGKWNIHNKSEQYLFMHCHVWVEMWASFAATGTGLVTDHEQVCVLKLWVKCEESAETWPDLESCTATKPTSAPANWSNLWKNSNSMRFVCIRRLTNKMLQLENMTWFVFFVLVSSVLIRTVTFMWLELCVQVR